MVVAAIVAPEIDTARAAQLDYWTRKAQAGADKLRALEGYGEEAVVGDSTDPNPRRWTGMSQYCAVMKRYLWCCEREGQLRTGHGPFWCGVCEENPGKGWRARNCLDCAWADYLADEARAFARELVAPAPCPRGCGQTLVPGAKARRHLATHRRVA